MPRRIGYAIVAAVLLIVGGLGAHRFASASGPFSPHDTDVNWDGRVNAIDIAGVRANFNAVAVGARPVQEANVDANGDIKVHEQGTVNVHVVSSAPKLYTLFNNEPFGGGQQKDSPFFDVSGCRDFQVFVNHGTASAGSFVLWSVDGSFAFRGQQFAASDLDSNPTNTFSFSGFAPYAGFRLVNNGGGGSITAHLYCVP